MFKPRWGGLAPAPAMLMFAAVAGLSAQAWAGSSERGRSKSHACVACHGVDGLSARPDAPHLAGQPAIYLREQLHLFRDGKRVTPVMSVVAKPLSDEDIEDLAEWYSSIEIQVKLPR